MYYTASIFRSLLISTTLWVAGLAGCYTPDLTASRFKCDRPQDSCPEGTQCIAGVCQKRTDDPSAPAAMDLAASPTVIPVKGCSGSGTLLALSAGKDAYACAGSFPGSTGSPVSLCASGYHVCQRADSALLLAARANGRCDSIPIAGFFAAEIAAGYDASGALLCEPKVAVATPALLGCGNDQGTRPADPLCNELVTVAPCDGSVNGWSCTLGLSTAVHGAGKPGGVLCCQT